MILVDTSLPASQSKCYTIEENNEKKKKKKRKEKTPVKIKEREKNQVKNARAEVGNYNKDWC